MRRSSPATAPRRARVGLRSEGSEGVRVSVQDNGVGFDPARAALLFKPFARLHARDDYAGSGIGLSIVQRIVERHGGRVDALGRKPAAAPASSSRCRAAGRRRSLRCTSCTAGGLT